VTVGRIVGLLTKFNSIARGSQLIELTAWDERPNRAFWFGQQLPSVSGELLFAEQVRRIDVEDVSDWANYGE
jgi:hypothetical protein